MTYAADPGYRPHQAALVGLTADRAGLEGGIGVVGHSSAVAEALASVGVPVELVPVEGAGHIFDGCDDVDAVVRLSVDWLAQALHAREPVSLSASAQE